MSDSVKDPLAHAYRGHLLHLPYEDVGAPRWTDFKAGYQVATAAADAEWRGVVEKLVGFSKHDAFCGIVGGYGYCSCGLEQALAQAEKLMGRK